MIIVTIDSTLLKLDTLEDAAALLDIAQRAIPVQKSWDSSHDPYFTLDETWPILQIEVVRGDRVLDREQHREARAARDEKLRQIEAAGIEADLA